MVETMLTSWIGVTPISCPMASEPMLVAPQRFGGRSRPRVSLGNWMPLREPKPNALI